MKNLLNPWAKDTSGKFVSIEHAQKGEDYFCPKCGEPLSYCKKGEGPHARQDHFKHKADTNCTGYTPHESESEIHLFAKEEVYRILHECLEKHCDFPISWTCSDCKTDMKGNLLLRAKSVEMEKSLDEARPDVSLLDEKGNTFVAIEIVVTHDVESNTKKFYDDNNIVVVRLKVHSAEDCNDIRQKLHSPDSVSFCCVDHCPCCERMQIYRKIIPLPDKDNQIAGLAVALDSPFEENMITRLNFTEQDKQNAIAKAKEIWGEKSVKFVYRPKFVFPSILQLSDYVESVPRPRRRRLY